MTGTVPCVSAAELFQHPLLEGSQSAKTSAERTSQKAMAARAREMCASCPLIEQCRYDAITRFDVTGIAGGTTASERSAVRRLLKVKLDREDFDTLAGASTANRQVDHNEVVRLRNMDPHGTLEKIAQRLGCSLSTVKRHLRKARTEPQPMRPEPTRLSVAEVNQAVEAVLQPRSRAA